MRGENTADVRSVECLQKFSGELLSFSDEFSRGCSLVWSAVEDAISKARHKVSLLEYAIDACERQLRNAEAELEEYLSHREYDEEGRSLFDPNVVARMEAYIERCRERCVKAKENYERGQALLSQAITHGCTLQGLASGATQGVSERASAASQSVKRAAEAIMKYKD